MSFIRWLLILVFITAILGFAMQNMQPVSVKVWTWESGEIPLYWVAFASFVVSAVLLMLVSLFYSIQHKREINRYRSQIKKLQQELDALRVVAVEEGLNEMQEETKSQQPSDEEEQA